MENSLPSLHLAEITEKGERSLSLSCPFVS